MRRVALLLFTMLCGGWTHGVAPPAITYNIATDFSATCNGSGNDSAAFATFNSTAKTWQSTHTGLIELDIPSGAVCVFDSGGSGLAFTSGLANLRVRGLGVGATLSDGGSILNSGYFLGGGSFGSGAGRAGIQNGANGTASSYIATVSAGSSTVTLLTPAQASLFSVGDWMLVAGINLLQGVPPDPGFWDYVQITNINAGVITFTPPLTHSYKSTWPVFSTGSAGQPDQGGAALVYQINQNWNTTQEYVNLTISQVGQTSAIGRDITLRNVIMTGSACVYPTQNITFRYIGVTGASCVIEMDKIVDTVYVQDSSFQSFHFQSASINNLVMLRSILTANLLGTPITTTVTNSSIVSPQVGALCCGVSATALFTNCICGSVMQIGANQSNVDSAFTMSGGVLSQATPADPVEWAIPGGGYYFLNGGGTHFPFTITDMAISGGNLNITTSLGGGYPSAGPLSVHAADVPVTIN